MDIKKYEALLSSIDLGSFSAAAEALGYTPAGISRMADAVEDWIGFPILNRGHDGVTVNACGADIISEIRQIVRHEAILKQQAMDISGLVTGDITVGSYHSIATHWLPEIFKKFHEDFPGVDISVREGGHQFLNEWMAEAEVDFCLYSHDTETGYTWFPLKTDRMVVVVPKGHPLADKKAVSFEDCEAYPFVMPAMGDDYDVKRLLSAHPMKLDIRFSTVENYSALAMVECGLGISIMNELITRGLKRDIICLPFEAPQSVSFGIAVADVHSLSPSAKKLIQYIRDGI